MAQITDRGRDLPRSQSGKFFAAKAGRAAVGGLTEEDPAKRGFAAGNGAGHTDDFTRVGRQIQAGKDGLFPVSK